jgi:hypothetical protein
VKKSTKLVLSAADRALPKGIEPLLTAAAALLDAAFTSANVPSLGFVPA